jgi:hypothetical protein
MHLAPETVDMPQRKEADRTASGPKKIKEFVAYARLVIAKSKRSIVLRTEENGDCHNIKQGSRSDEFKARGFGGAMSMISRRASIV